MNWASIGLVLASITKIWASYFAKSFSHTAELLFKICRSLSVRLSQEHQVSFFASFENQNQNQLKS